MVRQVGDGEAGATFCAPKALTAWYLPLSGLTDCTPRHGFHRIISSLCTRPHFDLLHQMASNRHFPSDEPDVSQIRRMTADQRKHEWRHRKHIERMDLIPSRMNKLLGWAGWGSAICE